MYILFIRFSIKNTKILKISNLLKITKIAKFTKKLTVVIFDEYNLLRLKIITPNLKKFN